VVACIFLTVDVLKAGAWSCFEELEDPELKTVFQNILIQYMPKTTLEGED